MGGKGGAGDMKWQQQAYNNAYSAMERGAGANAVMGQAGNYGQAYQMAIQDYKASQPVHFPEIKMPEMPEYDGPSYEEQMADADARYQQQMADAEKAQGIRDRDTLYGSYMSAADAATEYITGEIADESSNAALLGIDYTISDEQKNQRINDYFATVWSAGDEARLSGLMGKWGKPSGYKDLGISRGDASKYATKKGEQKSVGQSKGIKPTLATEEEEETLGATKSVLGGGI